MQYDSLINGTVDGESIKQAVVSNYGFLHNGTDWEQMANYKIYPLEVNLLLSDALKNTDIEVVEDGVYNTTVSINDFRSLTTYSFLTEFNIPVTVDTNNGTIKGELTFDDGIVLKLSIDIKAITKMSEDISSLKDKAVDMVPDIEPVTTYQTVEVPTETTETIPNIDTEDDYVPSISDLEPINDDVVRQEAETTVYVEPTTEEETTASTSGYVMPKKYESIYKGLLDVSFVSRVESMAFPVFEDLNTSAGVIQPGMYELPSGHPLLWVNSLADAYEYIKSSSNAADIIADITPYWHKLPEEGYDYND